MKTAIDLFSGAGGLSLGLKMAGFEIVAAFEFDKDAIKTHNLNFPSSEHICDDVQKVDFTKYRGIDLVVGGPPCQPFSISGKQLGKQDIRDMVPEFVRAVEQARPKAFLMENVDGLAGKRFLPYILERIENLKDLGYDVYYKVLNSADYGIPQKRMRLFIVGVIPGAEFCFPEPTHGPGQSLPYKTVREALVNCPIDEPNRAKITYGKNPVLRKSPYAGMLFNGKGRPLDLDAPSKTIPASAGGNRTHFIDSNGTVIDYHNQLMNGGKPRVGTLNEARRLTVRESARLQSFPDEFIFAGTRSRQYSQVGNAVPPAFAKVVIESIKKAFQKKKSLRKSGGKEKIFLMAAE